MTAQRKRVGRDVLRPRTSRRDGVLIARGSTRNCLRAAYLFADFRRRLDYDRRRRDGWARLADFLLCWLNS
jgi:hypothetical protein